MSVHHFEDKTLSRDATVKSLRLLPQPATWLPLSSPFPPPATTIPDPTSRGRAPHPEIQHLPSLQAQKCLGDPRARTVSVPLGGRMGRFLQCRFLFAGPWLLFSEISFISGKPLVSAQFQAPGIANP